MRLGVVGTGTIATAVVRGIAGNGHDITVSERSAANARALSEAFDNVAVQDNQGVVDASDVVMLGLIADAARTTLPDIAFRDDQRVISFMAGASADEVRQMVQPAPLSAVVMPYPAIASGGSPVIAQGDIDLVEDIFGVDNQVFAVRDEVEMAAYLCAQAVLSPTTQLVMDAAEWLGARVADGAQGEAFLRLLIGSSLGASECAPLLEALSTPGGFNQRLHHQMTGAGIGEALREGLDAIHEG